MSFKVKNNNISTNINNNNNINNISNNEINMLGGNLKHIVLLIAFLLVISAVMYLSIGAVSGASTVNINNKTTGGIQGAIDSSKSTNVNVNLAKGIYSSKNPNNINIIINKSVTIVGKAGKNSSKKVVIDAKGKGRVFTVKPEGKLKLINVTIKNGFSSWGSAIYNKKGSIIIENCIFSNNKAISKDIETYGGAIFNTGKANIKNSIFKNNRATDWGGAFYNGGKEKIIISNVNFINNKAIHGGAFFQDYGTLKLYNSKFTNNYASEEGGALSLYCHSLIKNCKFYKNNARYDAGAVFGGYGTIKVYSSYFNANYAEYGSGISSNDINPGTKIIVKNSNFKNNKGTAIVNQCKGSKIINNNIFGSLGGIDSLGANCIISHNIINGFNIKNSTGIYICGSNSKISYNKIYNVLYYGICIEGNEDGKNNTISNNIIIGTKNKNYNKNNNKINKKQGIGIFTSSYSIKNLIYKNTIKYFDYGIQVKKGLKSNKISKNHILNNNIGLISSYDFKNISNIFKNNKINIKVVK